MLHQGPFLEQQLVLEILLAAMQKGVDEKDTSGLVARSRHLVWYEYDWPIGYAQ